MQVVNPMKLHATRFPELQYAHLMPGVWRLIDASTGQTIGHNYKTRLELLADLERVAHDFGCHT